MRASGLVTNWWWNQYTKGFKKYRLVDGYCLLAMTKSMFDVRLNKLYCRLVKSEQKNCLYRVKAKWKSCLEPKNAYFAWFLVHDNLAFGQWLKYPRSTSTQMPFSTQICFVGKLKPLNIIFGFVAFSCQLGIELLDYVVIYYWV